MKSATQPSVDAPSEGFTGAGGVVDEMAPVARLPVASEPVFTDFGGAGAGSASDDEPGGGGGGAGQKAPVSNGGLPATTGVTSHAGSAGTTGGAKSAGGVTAAGGGAGEASSGGAPGVGASLIFSEYVEGSGSFKALELYALTASSLENCELQTYFNGKLEPARLALHGELAAGGVQVLCSTALATAQPSACTRSTSLTFNGDDALALSCGGELLDVIGEIGVDPGDSWGVGATADHTLRRRCEVTSGRRDGTAAFELDAEWLTLGRDTFSDLGVRKCPP